MTAEPRTLFTITRVRIRAAALASFLLAVTALAGEEWTQIKFDARHSGDVPDRNVAAPLGLIGAVPLTDAIFTAPVVARGRIFAIDGSGVAFAIDASTLEIIWKRETRGGRGSCNNISSPAIAGDYLHFGTMGGSYYVLRLEDGEVVEEIRCGAPIFTSPIVANERVYFVTLDARVHALDPDGKIRWTWSYLEERLGFRGDPFSGSDWRQHLGDRVTIGEQFCCTWDPAMSGKTLVLPAGGALVWLEDTGDRPVVRAAHVPRTPTLGLSIDETGAAFRQWHRLDNGGSVEILRPSAGKIETGQVPGTKTSTSGGLLSFSSVSLRGRDVYRCRPEEGYGLCRHRPDRTAPEPLGGYPSIASPILLRDQAVYGGLDGRLYVVPLSGRGSPWSFATASGKAISAPAAVCDGRIFFGCEDGYIYLLGPGGQAPLPSADLGLWKIRSPMTGPGADPRCDRFTSFANWSNTNANPSAEKIEPPFRIRWIHRFEGTTKHFSTCGGGRLYTHTAEGQIFAVEQETGRLLWRRYFPGVHICYTSPLYDRGRVLVPQAGLERCRLRCLDAATGKLLWEAPFSGSPSWNRQMPPVVSGKLAIYAFSSGKYEPGRWLVGHGEIPGFPKDQKPLVRAYDIDTGAEVWTKDFSEFGTGGDDGGLCLMDGTIYYSCFLGYLRKGAAGTPRATGITAALDPATGRVLWSTTAHAVHSGCTISGEDGRLYLGGYSAVEGKVNRVWCLDAKDGSLVWQSEPISKAIHVITIGDGFLFAHSQYENGYLIDKGTGSILRTLTKGYKCTRFTLCGSLLLGANMDIYDLSDPADIRLLSTGPAVDPSQCVGAIVSNGRVFYTAHGSGLQVSQVCGAEAASALPPWKTTSAATTGAAAGAP
ncbi:MAG: PQQ-binding-like beta-propeller repeat protein [Planctomycetes bacterium]|nr:PQQ-binding-like beta-propeller repeat protein [Planctomycetota bacterium]